MLGYSNDQRAHSSCLPSEQFSLQLIWRAKDQGALCAIVAWPKRGGKMAQNEWQHKRGLARIAVCVCISSSLCANVCAVQHMRNNVSGDCRHRERERGGAERGPNVIDRTKWMAKCEGWRREAKTPSILMRHTKTIVNCNKICMNMEYVMCWQKSIRIRL